MKNFFKIHPRRYARGLIIGLVLILAIAFIVNLFGCGNDTVTNSNNPPNTTLYSLDSFSLYLQVTTPTDIKDSITFILNDTSINTVNITFDMKSNVTSGSGAYAQFKSNDFTQDSLPAIFFDIFNSVNSSYSFTFTKSVNFTYPVNPALIASLHAESQSGLVYFVIRKFKVTKIS